MRSFTAFDGNTYSISDRFGPINNVEGATMDQARAVESNRRTLDNIVRFLDGVSPADALDDPNATLDQVHGNAWHPDTCGCRVLVCFDHYSESKEPRAHRTTLQCVAHAHLKDHKDHHAELLEENKHKNQVVALVAESLGVEPHEIEWRHDDQRQLFVKHKDLKDRKQLDAALSKRTLNRTLVIDRD